MTFLPVGTILGQLEVLDVFEQFDGPKLFTCRNGADACFLVVWVDDHAGAEDVWLYAPVSTKRVAALKLGEFELRRAFIESEGGVVHLVRTSRSGGISAIESMASNTIPDELLPDRGVTLRAFPEPAGRIGRAAS